jgi:hypothetical protein
MRVMVVAVIGRRGRGCEKAGDRPHSSADCGPKGRTVTPGSSSADCSPTARTDETAADETLHGIEWIGASRQPQDQPGREHAGDDL